MLVDLEPEMRLPDPGPSAAPPAVTRAPTILVFDSGLGGLTVFAEAVKARPEARFVYAADDAGFPYGRLDENALIARVLLVMDDLIARFAPDAVVIACNTASTLVLPHLRVRFAPLPFVGTVPAIKPAATLSRSHVIAVLGTPGTVRRDYTHDLVRTYAAHCSVTLVGAEHLAGLAEAFMRGEAIDDGLVAREIAPCFVERDSARTDCIVLACTHYPLLTAAFERVAPWPVTWIDPAPAIARRLDHVLRENPSLRGGGAPAEEKHEAVFTSGLAPNVALAAALQRRGLRVG